MPVVVEQRKLYRQPGSGSIRANRSHFAAADLQYLFVPQHGLVRNLVGSNEILAPATSAAKFQPSVAGWSATSDATDSRFALSSPPRVTALDRDVTMLWTGVFHGAGGGGNIVLFGQTYGTGASTPFTTIALSRPGTANQDQLGMFSNNGASGFINWVVNCSLSSHYGRVVTFAVSQVAGVGGLNAVFVTPTSTTTFSNVGNAQSGLSGNPRASSASDVFLLGGYPADTTRHPNASTALAAAWSRALTLEQLVRLAQDPWSVVQGSRVVVPFEIGGGGSITMPAGQGSFSLSGQNATFVRDVPVVAGQGTFSLAGQDVVFVRGVPMVAGQGSFSLSGQDAGFTLGGNLNMAANYGAISLSGQTAAFLRAVSITAAQGSFALNGQAATFVQGISVTLDPGTFALSGQDVDLRKAGNATLAANFGSYTLTGQAAVLAKSLAWQETTPASGTWVEQSAAAGSWTPLA